MFFKGQFIGQSLPAVVDMSWHRLLAKTGNALLAVSRIIYDVSSALKNLDIPDGTLRVYHDTISELHESVADV